MKTILIYHFLPEQIGKIQNLIPNSVNETSCVKHILTHCEYSVYWNRTNVGYLEIFIIVPSSFQDNAPTPYISTQCMAGCGLSLPHLYHVPSLPLTEILISSFYVFKGTITSGGKFLLQISYFFLSKSYSPFIFLVKGYFI